MKKWLACVAEGITVWGGQRGQREWEWERENVSYLHGVCGEALPLLPCFCSFFNIYHNMMEWASTTDKSATAHACIKNVILHLHALHTFETS